MKKFITTTVTTALGCVLLSAAGALAMLIACVVLMLTLSVPFLLIGYGQLMHEEHVCRDKGGTPRREFIDDAYYGDGEEIVVCD
jgi:hypothetical protein